MPSLTILGPPVIVKPSVFITVLPVVTLVKFFNSFDNLTLSAPFADTTPILSSDNLFASAPPLMDNFSPNCLLMSAPVSPAKFKPFAMVLLIFVIFVVLVSCCALDAISVNVTCFLSPLSLATVNTMLPSLSALYLPWLFGSGFATKR